MVFSAGRVARSDTHIAASILSFRSGRLEPGRTVNGSAYLALRHPACQRKGVGSGGSLANGIVIASTELYTPGIAAAPNCNPDIDGDGAFLATTDALIFFAHRCGHQQQCRHRRHQLSDRRRP